jgi:hypothetical protein
MCDDHVSAGGPAAAGQGMTRRNFMHATAATAAGAALLRQSSRIPPRLPLRSAARPVTRDGTSAYSMAMHIHSSFSEQTGSMASQLYQAATNSVDVLWWTDHDFRMDNVHYRDVVHFTSLTKEKGGPGQGGAWDWQQVQSGPVGYQSGGGIVQQPASPNDPAPHGSLSLTAQSRSNQTAKYGFYANSTPARMNYRDNLTGQSLLIDVLLDGGWSARDGYLELLIVTSYHQASGGRPAGSYSLSYRFVPPGTPAGRVAQGTQGVITIPVQPEGGGNSWFTAAMTPASDIAALWPDLDYRDFALWELTLNAASNGQPVHGYFDYLRFDRSISGETSFQQQASMMAALAPQYPVTQQQGLEVSWQMPHVNWFGGQVTVPSYGAPSEKAYKNYLENTFVPQVHASGGLVSYNHPFGVAFGGNQLPVSKQNRMLQRVAGEMLPAPGSPAAVGADLLEVGYVLRQGVDLAHHVGLWDIMSRNAVFLTGNGTSDDHYGRNWRQLRNNWITWAWAASENLSDLLAAMASGRVWCGSMTDYQGSLDLMVDEICPMGSASVSGVNSRQLTASVTGAPSYGSLQVLQGDVDYAGVQGLESNVRLIGNYPSGQLRGGTVTQAVDTSTSSFVRTQVLDATGSVVALSNPVWLLRSEPPGGIPDPRAA